MKIFLLDAYAELGVSNTLYSRFVEIAKEDRHSKHECVNSPAEADAILVTGVQHHLENWNISKFKKSPTARNYRDKLFVYCDVPEPPYIGPGLYTNVTRQTIDSENQVPACYLCKPRNYFYRDEIFDRIKPDLLYSFSGTYGTHPVRRVIPSLNGPRVEITDTTGTFWYEGGDKKRQLDLLEHYRKQVARSKFVLCPRGIGANSFRLFEVLGAGRVPVIISDQWCEPNGPDWSQIAIRVPEARIGAVPEIIQAQEHRYESMVHAGRIAFDKYFATESLFNWAGDRLEKLAETRKNRWRAAHARSFKASCRLRLPDRCRAFIPAPCKTLIKSAKRKLTHRA